MLTWVFSEVKGAGRAGLPIPYQLYLPGAWTKDAKRRRKTGVPEPIGFRTKPQIAVRSRLKGGRFQYAPLTPELAAEYRQSPKVLGAEKFFPARKGTKGERRRVEGSFRTLLEAAKILGHSNIKMTERYAKLAKNLIARTGLTACELWKLMDKGDGEQSAGTL